MSRSFLTLALALLGMVICTPTSAQMEVQRFRIAGGGASSSGGSWSLTGTIGQGEADVIALCSADGADPSLCEGASIEITGGFWAGMAPADAHASCDSLPDCLFRDGFEELP